MIHCATLTSIRKCENDKQKAFEVNVRRTRDLLNALDSIRDYGYFVYVSTGCVFSGDEDSHFYSEFDLLYPKNFYWLFA